MLLVKGKSCTPIKTGHILIVRSDNLIQQCLLGFYQEGCDERVSLLSRKALECQGVVSSPQLGKMLQQLWRDVRQIDTRSEQAVEQVQARKACRDRWCLGCRRCFLKSRQRRTMLSLRDDHQVIDRIAESVRQFCYNAFKEIL